VGIDPLYDKYHIYAIATPAIKAAEETVADPQ